MLLALKRAGVRAKPASTEDVLHSSERFVKGMKLFVKSMQRFLKGMKRFVKGMNVIASEKREGKHEKRYDYGAWKMFPKRH